MTFDGFARAALRGLGVDVTQTETETATEKGGGGRAAFLSVGGEASVKKTAREKRRQIGAEEIDPWRLFLELRELDKKVVVVLDEYDVVGAANGAFHKSVAELIKTLADNSADCDSRLLIVGIARSAELLLGRHESIERSVKELYLRPLDEHSVHDFLTIAEEQLSFTFKPSVKEAIVAASGGFPYFVHLVGLESLDVMHARDPKTRVVEEHDYQEGVRRAVQAAFRAELRKYREAVKSLTDHEVTVMRELAFISRKRVVNEDELKRHLLHTTSVSRDQYADSVNRLRKTGLIFIISDKKHVRFTDPLMAPFLRARLFASGNKDPDVRQLSLLADIE